MTSMVTADDLASEFCRILRDWLTSDELAEIDRRNSLPEYSGCCASHDFCDPNQAMADALSVFGLAFDTEMCDLINAAWSIASSNGFQEPVPSRVN